MAVSQSLSLTASVVGDEGKAKAHVACDAHLARARPLQRDLLPLTCGDGGMEMMESTGHGMRQCAPSIASFFSFFSKSAGGGTKPTRNGIIAA